MAIDETPTSSALLVDRGYAVGNSLGNDNRLALHVKVKNLDSEPINVNIVESPVTLPEEIISPFAEVSSVASGIETDILTYTVPPGQIFYMQLVEVGGTNISAYSVYDGISRIGFKRTWFAPGLNERFLYAQDLKRGLKFDPGAIVRVSVLHQRPEPGDFEARLVGVLVG